MKIDIPNPLLTEQVVLLQIRKAIIAHLPGAVIETKDAHIRQDYTRASARIIRPDGKPTSLCEGYVISAHQGLLDILNAEIIALIFCAAEIGLDIQFEGGPVEIKTPEIAPRVERVKWDRSVVSAFKNTPQVYAAMKRLGLTEDMERVRVWNEERKRAKERTYPSDIADFLFGKTDVPKYVEVAPTIVRTKAPEPVFKATETQSNKRSGKEAQDVMYRLNEAGITQERLKSSKYGDRFSSLVSFSIAATDQEIQDLCESE